MGEKLRLSRMAAEIGIKFKLAYLVPTEGSPDGLFELVARARDLNVRRFHDERKAREWLARDS